MSSTGFQNIHHDAPLESAITNALEQQPAPVIPADFAARVTMRAATLPVRSRAPRAHYARSISIGLSAAMVICLFVLAPHMQPTFTSLGFDIELCLTALLGGLLYWLTPKDNASL